MNTLIILAHPKTESLSNHIAQLYTKNAEKKHQKVTLLDLYKEEHQWFLTLEHNKNRELNTFQQKIQDNDQIILCFPIWWFDAPAILKNFRDVNLSRGFAYKTNDKWKQEGLLQWKSVRIITTAWWPRFLKPIYKFIFWFVWGMGRIKFCGMKYLWTTILMNAVNASDQDKQSFFEKIEKLK